MELRSGRSLDRGRPRRRVDGDGGGEDRISDLPDELLLHVLAGLGSTAEAARTSLVARRWRRRPSLWTELDVLIFRGFDTDTLRDLLARAQHPQLPRLEIRVPRQHGGVAAAQITFLLRAAEEHGPAEFFFEVGVQGADDLPFELPSFRRATFMNLQIWGRSFTLPPAGGQFARLTRLTISFCSAQPSHFLSRCPNLRVLDMCCYWMLNEVTVSSKSLEQITMRDAPVPSDQHDTPQRVNIEAPMLSKFRLQSWANRDLIMSFSASMLESLLFSYCCRSSRFVGFGQQWRLLNLSTAMEWSSRHGQRNPVRMRVLSMVIDASNDNYRTDASRSFTEEMLRLPVNNISVFKLELRTAGHAFGIVVLQLLKSLNNVLQRIQLILPPSDMRGMCSKKDYAEYNRDMRRNHHIRLPVLQEVEIEGFNVTYHDLCFLDLLLKSAPVLKIVRIKLSKEVSQSDKGYKKLCCMLQAYTSIKCFVNGSGVKEIFHLAYLGNLMIS